MQALKHRLEILEVDKVQREPILNLIRTLKTSVGVEAMDVMWKSAVKPV